VGSSYRGLRRVASFRPYTSKQVGDTGPAESARRSNSSAFGSSFSGAHGTRNEISRTPISINISAKKVTILTAMHRLPRATRIKEESLKIVKLKLGVAGVEWVEEFSLSSTWGAAFLGTRTSPNMLQARHKPAITLHVI
jgi:hypothetical protein